MAYGLTKSLDLESGSSQFVSRSSAANLRLKNDFTLEGWFNFESLPSSGNRMWFIDKKSEAGEDFSVYAFFIDNTAGTYTLVLRTTNGSSSSNIDRSVTWTPSTATWYHLAVSREDGSGNIKFYVGGSQQGATQTGYVGTLSDDSDLGFYIGRYKSGDGRFFDGKVSLVRCWSAERTSGEISGNMCNVYGTSETNMQGEWSFNDVYTDASGNGYTLTPSGSPVFATDVPAVCSVVGPTTVKTFDGVTQSTGINTYFGQTLATTKTVNGIS